MGWNRYKSSVCRVSRKACLYVPDEQGHVDTVLPELGFQEDLERHVESVPALGKAV